MKTFVINLERHKNRFESISSLLNQYHIEYKITSAIDGGNFSKEQWSKLKINQSIEVCGRNLSKGEIACSLSHLNIYKEIVKTSLPYGLILEDDAFFDHRLKNTLKNLEVNITKTKPIILILSHANKYNMISNIKIGSVKFYKAIEVYGAHGYIINKKACELLIDKYTKINHPIDNWRYISESYGIDIYCQIPYTIGHTNFAKFSSIETERKEMERIFSNLNKKTIGKLIDKWSKKSIFTKRQKEDQTLEKHR